MNTNTDPVRALIELRTGVEMDAAHDPMGAAKLEALDAAIAALASAPRASAPAAVAAIQFALTDPEGMTFLRLWNQGEFDTLRREWPDAPSEIYVGADPLAAQQPAAPDFCDAHCTWLDHAPGCPRHEGQQPAAPSVGAEQRARELLEAECGRPLPLDVPVCAAHSAVVAALSQQPAAVDEAAAQRLADAAKGDLGWSHLNPQARVEKARRYLAIAANRQEVPRG